MPKNAPSYIDVGSRNYPFPPRDKYTEEQKNGEEYNLQYAQAIYSRYLRDKCALRYGSRETVDTIRLYGRGNQPKEIYKEFMEEKIDTDSNSTALARLRGDKTRQGWENIAQKVISPLPRIRKIIKGYLDNVGQDVFVDALDPISNDMKDNAKARMYAVAQNFDFVQEFHMEAGIPMEELEYLPASRTELNLFEAMGGFKMNYARAMEKLIKHTEDISELDDQLKDDWIDDATDLGVIAGRVHFNPETGKYEYKYLDPKYMVIQYVREDDYRKSEFAGYVETYTISELKQRLPEKEEDFFHELAYAHKGKLGNEAAANWDNFSKQSSDTGSYNYDDFNVEVLEVEWIDYEVRRHQVYNSVHGRKMVRPMKKDEELKPLQEYAKKNGAKREELNTKMRKLRGCKWIVGTECVFDHGLVNMQDRPKKSEVMHSFRLYTLRDEPLTEQLVPIADDMALAWFRWQDDRAMLQRYGYAIDVGMMENIEGGGKKYDFVDVLKAWRRSRHLFHQQSLSGKYEGGNTTPIQPIPSLVKEALEEFIMTWEAALKRIEDVTGLNLVILGASAPQGSQVTTTQMSAQSAAHILKPVIRSLGRMRRELAQTTMRRLQLAFKAREDIAKGYIDVVGEYDVELLKMAEKSSVQYGMRFEDKPSEEMKETVIAAAQLSLQARRDGKPGIKNSEFQYIVQQVQAGGSIKELSALLDYLELKAEQRVQENKERDIQLQGQQNVNLEKAKVEAEKRKRQLETQGDVVVEREKRQTELAKIYAEKGNIQGNGSPVTPRPESP